MRILLLSDCAATCKPLLNILHAEQYHVTHQAGLAGPATAADHAFDLVVLEGGLTVGADATAWLGAPALRNQPPVLLYSAAGGRPPDPAFRQLPGVRYYPQPLTAAQLLHEVVHQEVRHCAAANSATITLADLHFNAYKKTVSRAGKLIKLTLKEFLLLKLLLLHKNRLVLRHDIIQQLWGTITVQRQSSLTLYINLLRGKIDAGHPQRLLHTIRGRGYMLRGE